MLRGEKPVINGDGKHTRDYVYVEDLVEAVVKAVDYTNPDYFNISSGVETSNLLIFDTIRKVTGASFEPQFGPERPGDVRRNALYRLSHRYSKNCRIILSLLALLH